LDPYDSELRLWLFRLDLLEVKFTNEPQPEPPPPAPLPDSGVALSWEELEEAWKDASLSNWSKRRMTVAVLDAFGEPMLPSDLIEKLSGLVRYHRLKEPVTVRQGDPYELLEDGRLSLNPNAEGDVRKVRDAVREQLRVVRRYAARFSTEEMEAARVRHQEKKEQRVKDFQKMRRAIVVTFPPERPVAATLVDAGTHTIETFIGPDLDDLCLELEGYDYIGAVNVRGVLRALGFEPGARRLAELGPPQKTIQINKSGRTLKITNTLLAQGSCGISKPFGDSTTMKGYVLNGDTAKLARRLEADAKSLYALYEYGRLHGWVRLRWGSLDEGLIAPWVDNLESKLWSLKDEALKLHTPLEVVLGNAPSWSDPWARAETAIALKDESSWHVILADQDGYRIDEADIQRARLLHLG